MGIKHVQLMRGVPQAKAVCCRRRAGFLVTFVLASVVVRRIFQTMSLNSAYMRPRGSPVFHNPESWPEGFSWDISNETAQNDTLVVLTGSIRGGEQAWETLYRNVLDVNQADLMLVVSKESQAKSSLWNRSKFTLRAPEYEDWADAMDEIMPNKHPDWRKIILEGPKLKKNILMGAANNISGSGAIVFTYRYYVAKFLRHTGADKKYKRFIITRTDHYYACPHDIQSFELDKYLYVPSGEDYGGVCDRHLVAGREFVQKAINMWPPLVEYPHLYKTFSHRRKYNTERFLQQRWNEENLLFRRFDRNLFLIQAANDTSRWSTGKDETLDFLVRPKYPKEVDASRRTCREYLLTHTPPGGIVIEPKSPWWHFW